MNTRYEFNMDVPPREAIRLLYVSKSRFGGDWNSVPHTHSCTEVFYCVDGRGQFNVEGKMLDVAPDDMVIVNPRTLHTELSYQANPLEYIVLGINLPQQHLHQAQQLLPYGAAFQHGVAAILLLKQNFNAFDAQHRFQPDPDC